MKWRNSKTLSSLAVAEPPAYFDNMDFLNSVAHTVYLRADADTICAHLSVSKGRRPLLEGKSPEELRAFVTAH